MKTDLTALSLALPYVRDWSIAIDGGANRGDWTAALIERFNFVHAFEPALDMVSILTPRFHNHPALAVHPHALWSHEAWLSLEGEKPWGRYVTLGGTIRGRPIDGLRVSSCGLIKLDLEGAELMALQGARATLLQCKPVLVIECKQRLAQRFNSNADEPGKYLADLGAREIARHGPDRIYAWR